MKKRLFLLLFVLLLAGCAPATPPDTGRLQIVTTVFPAYDFARAVSGGLADVTLLLPPGTESHSYEPTPADILAVRDCNLFIYLGGESDAWVDTILDAVEPTGRQLRMMDCVPLLEEMEDEDHPGHSHDHAHDHGEDHDGDHGLGSVVGMDEHVWTAPANAADITLAIGEAMADLEPDHGDAYRAHAASYAGRLTELDGKFRDFFASVPRRAMVFGDRFPLQYFAAAYGIDCYVAFPGCGAQTEPSAATIAFLTEKVRQEQLPTVWYIEFSNHLVADSIAEATGVSTAMFHTCHNVSRQEIEEGATYLSLMERNLETLKANW